jgi:hypothetical protein
VLTFFKKNEFTNLSLDFLKFILKQAPGPGTGNGAASNAFNANSISNCVHTSIPAPEVSGLSA